MKLIKTAAAVVNQTPLAWETNKQNIVAAIHDAQSQNVSILCFPELCISGYGCEDAFLSAGLQKTALEILFEIIPETSNMVVTLGLPLEYRGVLFNAVAIVADGKLIGFVPKQNLAGDGIHYEPRWFEAWPANHQTTIEVDGTNYPLGDLIFQFDGVLIGLEICEDAWVATRPGIQQAKRAVDIILNPSASHFAFDKQTVRQRFVLEGSRAFHASYVYANLLGNESGRAIYDGGAMIASAGKMLASGPRFSFADHHVISAVIDVDLTRMNRARSEAFQLDYQFDDSSVIRGEFTFPQIHPEESTVEVDSWETGNDLKEEEFSRAVSLALFDYLRKSYSRGFVISLSGGADSAAVATLCSFALRFAMAELGPEKFTKKLHYIASINQQSTEDEIAAQLITCAYQATRNSSDTTFEAAMSIADAIHAEFHRFDVDALVEGYLSLGEQALARPLNWQQDDIALQNIQARTRAPSVWLLANCKGALLLSTSNRSEAAVGYATMDGDTCGGVSPVAGIDKAFLRKWLCWVEEIGPNTLGPLPALRAINVQAPTAELRPQNSKQTDEDDLMPYELLDAIERAAIRDKQVPLEVLQRMTVQFTQYNLKQLADWVQRFFTLWCRNQWKRERYAPSFHLDDENLDPKTWCRFPILSGGFQRELKQMWEWVDSK